jgi:hypothetical protein
MVFLSKIRSVECGREFFLRGKGMLCDQAVEDLHHPSPPPLTKTLPYKLYSAFQARDTNAKINVEEREKENFTTN